MAEDQIPDEVEANIAASLGEDVKPRRRKKRREPSYRVVGATKIPVSEAHGKVWKSRKDMGMKAINNMKEVWDQALRYFDNDQTGHRQDSEGTSGNLIGNQRLNKNITETENVVFSNVTTMVPALYARNPRAEFTSNTEGMKKLATITERLVNVLGAKKASPGLNLKPKAKRCVVTTLLTNRSWIKIGWTFKDDSSEQALEDLADLAKQLEKAKQPKDVEEIEGKIMALEDSIDILQVAGPSLSVKGHKTILIDPTAQEIDLTDAKWAMEEDFLPTQFLLAKYAKRVKDSDQFESIYKPSHVIKAGSTSDSEHETNTFSLFEKDSDAKSFGFDDEESFKKAQVTRVWFVWDRTTRRVLLYNHDDWKWPIWVWDDPLQLDNFFPFYPLTFFESPKGPLTKGEVTYYLDQQDAINEMVDAERRARRWALRNVFFNKNAVKKADVEAVLNGDDGTARGVDVPDGMKLRDMIDSVVPPGMQFKELFDKESKYRAIDRISSVGEVLRGAQFKTNTNKDAVKANVSASNMRVDEKSDQIEDWMGAIYWGIAQLCLQHMPLEQVVALVGEEARDVWKNMEAAEIQATFSVQVVGGSTKKPTSRAKKEEALELGQVLGQFINAAPGPVLKVMLQVMQEAFDEVVIKEEDWDEIINAIEQQGQQQPQGAPAAPGQSQPQPQGQPTNGAGPQGAQQLEEILAQIPDEVKAQIVQAIQSGIPPQQALQEGLAKLQPQQ